MREEIRWMLTVVSGRGSGGEIKRTSQSPHPLQRLATVYRDAVNDAWTNDKSKTHVIHAHAALKYFYPTSDEPDSHSAGEFSLKCHMIKTGSPLGAEN